MPAQPAPGLNGLLEALGLGEMPLGLFYSDTPPAQGLRPEPLERPTREREMAGQINWDAVFGGFSCAMGHIWRARRKHAAAWFSADHYGCAGAAFWLGFTKPQTETIAHYVSSGIPGHLEGEHYLATPDQCRGLFELADPRPAPRPYLVVKPLDLLQAGEEPELVAFFARPESLTGLFTLATYVTGRAEAVRVPFSAACGALAAWPLHYLAQGQDRVAVLGGLDPSARQFYQKDELSFTVSRDLYDQMLQAWPRSFLTRKTWQVVKKKASARA
ncbi:MAG: DUF169 domain-containing protein [Desulfarculus sp.]|nr:DUF169 domain-containing protein [Desulfarculus sp.]